MWEGTFGYCSDPSTAADNNVQDYYVYRTAENGIEDQTACEDADFEWKNAELNFDSFGQALHSVLVIFTFNGWQKLFFSAINARCAGKRHTFPPISWLWRYV